MPLFFKQLRERIKLLEYENILIKEKLVEMEKQLKPIKPSFSPWVHKRDGSGHNEFEYLRKKYRPYEEKYSDGL